MPRVQKKAAIRIRRPRPRHEIVKADVVTPTVWTPQKRERELTQSEIDLVHRTVAKGTSPDQFSLFLWFCRKHGYDPVAKEVYCVLFKVTKHHQDFNCPGKPECMRDHGNTGIWHEGYDMTIMTGIGGLRNGAARNHPGEYGEISEPVWVLGDQKTKYGKIIPTSCSVSVWKKGAVRPTTATVFWDEYAPNLEDDRAQFWNKMPKNQLAKCAEAQALKKAYPDLSNIYVQEEMARREMEYTEEGRRIIPNVDAITVTSGPTLDENAAHGHEPGSRKATMAEEALRKVEEDDAKFKAAEREAITVEAKTDVADVWPKTSGSKKEPEKPKRTTEGKSQRSSSSVEPHIAEGTITHSVAGMAGKVPVRDVSMYCPVKKTKPSFRCFDRALFEYLDKGIGKDSAVIVKQNGKYWNLVGLVRVGSQHFDNDGKTPVVTVDREPGILNFGNGK